MRWPWQERRRAQGAFEEAIALLNTQVVTLQRENAQLRDRLLEKDRHYAALVERIAAPVAPPPPPIVNGDPTARALEHLRDDTIERMAADFMENGMEKEQAFAHARELAQQAEAVWGG